MRNPEDFTFFVKAFQDFTRKGDLSGVSEFEDGIEPMREAIPKRAKRLFVYFNNCHRGQAAANAESMKRIIEQARLW